MSAPSVRLFAALRRTNARADRFSGPPIRRIGSRPTLRADAPKTTTDRVGSNSRGDRGPPEGRLGSVDDKAKFRYPYPLETIDNFPLNCQRAAGTLDHGAKFRLPSVTKILERTRPEEGRRLLACWQSDMTAKMGQENFAKFMADRTRVGHCLHEALLMQHLTLKTAPDRVLVSDQHLPYWNSLRPVLADFGRLLSKELWVVHEALCYKGQADALVEFKNRTVVLELKVSDRLKSNLESTYDAPLQLAAYVGAVNCSGTLPAVSDALIVVCYKDRDASVFELDIRYLQYYWQKWLERLKAFWEHADNQLQ